MPAAEGDIRRVPYVNFSAQFDGERDEIHAVIDRVFGSGQFVGGEEVDGLEAALADYCGVKHVVTVNSGTDALTLALKVAGIGPGDQVITPPNSFVASTSVIANIGATPVFADVLDDQNIDPEAIRSVVTAKTKAILPVHLTGRIADMAPIMEIADDHGLVVIEDAAQAVGSRYDGRAAGAIGQFGCFSTHPLKNLNAAGDGGFITTDDDDAAARLRRLRNHGLMGRDTVNEWGVVSRMDALQAAILRLRLGKLDGVIAARRGHGEIYRREITACEVFMPPCREIEFNSFHTFVIQATRRDALKEYLKEHGIETAIHYPVPLHLQPAAKTLGFGAGDFPVAEAQADKILSLPVHQYLDAADIRHVARAINKFYGEA